MGESDVPDVRLKVKCETGRFKKPELLDRDGNSIPFKKIEIHEIPDEYGVCGATIEVNLGELDINFAAATIIEDRELVEKLKERVKSDSFCLAFIRLIREIGLDRLIDKNNEERFRELDRVIGTLEWDLENILYFKEKNYESRVKRLLKRLSNYSWKCRGPQDNQEICGIKQCE